MATLIVTCRNTEEATRTRAAVRRAVPGGRICGTGFTGVFRVEAGGDSGDVAEQVVRDCGPVVGHVTAVLVEVASEPGELLAAAVRAGVDHVGRGESFAVRLHKRGVHSYAASTTDLERDVGAAVWAALEARDATAPRVDLTDPDVTIAGEVFGSVTSVGIQRRAWRTEGAAEPEPPGFPSS